MQVYTGKVYTCIYKAYTQNSNREERNAQKNDPFIYMLKMQTSICPNIQKCYAEPKQARQCICSHCNSFCCMCE